VVGLTNRVVSVGASGWGWAFFWEVTRLRKQRVGLNRGFHRVWGFYAWEWSLATVTEGLATGETGRTGGSCRMEAGGEGEIGVKGQSSDGWAHE